MNWIIPIVWMIFTALALSSSWIMDRIYDKFSQKEKRIEFLREKIRLMDEASQQIEFMQHKIKELHTISQN